MEKLMEKFKSLDTFGLSFILFLVLFLIIKNKDRFNKVLFIILTIIITSIILLKIILDIKI